MSMRYLGPSFDIHTGGVDLVFPHHEDEIAQSEAATGQPFVRTWLHCAHLRWAARRWPSGPATSSDRPTCTPRGYSPRALRYALLAAHYRAAPGVLRRVAAGRRGRRRAALDAARRARRATARTRPTTPTLAAPAGTSARRRSRPAWTTTSTSRRPWPRVFDLVRELNRRLDARSLSTADAGRGGRLRARPGPGAGRGRGRAARDPRSRRAGGAARGARRGSRRAATWPRSDRLRDELAARGIVVEDTRDGQRWRRIEEAVDA